MTNPNFLFLKTVIALALVFFPYVSSAIPFSGQKIVIAGPSAYAVEAGKKIAAIGGNVVDVAVAVELALSVTNSYHASLGGGGFALVKMDGKIEALDFRETAPAQTSSDFFLKPSPKSSVTGGTSIGTPGIPAGLWALHKKYGKLHWSQLFTTAIDLAEKGFEVSGQWNRIAREEASSFNLTAKQIFLRKDQTPYGPGERVVQKGLAKLLKEMRNRGIVPFYQGMASRDMVASISKAGGVLTLSDLKNYKVRWLSPLTTEFKGNKVYLMPPPSSGGVVIAEALKLADMKDLPSFASLSVDELHLMAEILNRSFQSRSLLADPDFYQNPISDLLSEKRLRREAESISLKKTLQPEPLTAESLKESSETTHFSVMDIEGNAVAMTVTLNGNWGSGIVSEQFGIAMNNEMDDFTTKPGQPNQFGLIQGTANQVQPGKRPLSSMSPAIVEKDGKTLLAVGSPGGPRIISAVFQVLYRYLVKGYDIDRAIQTPRVHNQYLPQILYIDPHRLPPETLEALESRGHKVEESDVARVYGVARGTSPETKNFLQGAYDNRAEGAAGGF